MKTKIQKLHFFYGFFAIFCMIFCVFSISGFSGVAAADSSTYVVTANSAIVYELPDFSSTTVATLSHKDEVTVELDSGTAKVYDGEGAALNRTFYYIVDTGYILTEFVAVKTEEVVQIPSFNAQLSEDAAVYELSGSNYVKTSTTLAKGTRVYLYEGFDEDELVTAISYVLDDEVCFGYVDTDAISPDGINSTVITCAIIIIAVLGIIFAWLFIKNRDRKIRKEGKKALKEQKRQKKAEKMAKKQQKKLKNEEKAEIEEN